MEANNPEINGVQAGTKKRILPSALEGKFKSKDDFLKYFRNMCK